LLGVLVAAFCLLFLTAPVMAQASGISALQSSPLSHIAPVEPPSLGRGLPNFQSHSTEGTLPAVMIPVSSVSIIGATAFPPSQLGALVAGFAHQEVPLSKLESTRRNLVALYRDHGFVLSTVSMDIDAQGNVRFIVTEGHIVAVQLSQNIGPVGDLVLAFLDHLTDERPVSEASLERWLLLAQQIPGISVHAVLQSDSDDPGALTLVAEVSRQAVSALATADNRSFPETGPAEGLAVFDVNSLTAFGDQTEVSLFHTSGNTDNFGQAAESFFIGNGGLRLRLYGGAGRAWPSGTLREADYESSIEVFGAALSYPVLLRRNQSLNLSLHFDGTDNLASTQDLRAGSDNVRAARLFSQYAWQDLWLGNSRSGISVVNFGESQGLPILGAAPDGRAVGVSSRFDEKTDFWKLNFSISRIQTLYNPFPQSSVALRLEAGGQYTDDILPSAEEFELGGSRFTRGYYSGEVTGDTALYATAELQFNTSASFNILALPVDLGAQFYSFYDYGESWSNLTSDFNHRLASAGVGVRLGITQQIEIDGEFDKRLVTQLDAADPNNPPLSGTAIYWGATVRY
jgi:hemolysin activation/secretion protein